MPCLSYALELILLTKFHSFSRLTCLSFDFLGLDLLTLLRNLIFNNFRKSWYKKTRAFRACSICHWSMPFYLASDFRILRISADVRYRNGLSLMAMANFAPSAHTIWRLFRELQIQEQHFVRSPKIIDFIWYFLHNHYTRLWLIAFSIVLYRIWFYRQLPKPN